MKCSFNRAWIGKCGKENCEDHAELKCCSCGAPATHECAETFQFVCGFYLCDLCEHEISEDGTTSEIKHCRKVDQKFKPWYVEKE